MLPKRLLTHLRPHTYDTNTLLHSDDNTVFLPGYKTIETLGPPGFLWFDDL